MSAGHGTTRWARFTQLSDGRFIDPESVALNAEQARALLRESCGSARAGGKLIHFMVPTPDGALEHYLLHREDADGQHAMRPTRPTGGPGAATAARLRALADAIEHLAVPDGARPAISVVFEKVDAVDAGVLAKQLADTYHDARTLHAPTHSVATWFGTATVPPAIIDFLCPDAPGAVYCGQCGGLEVRDDFETLRQSDGQDDAAPTFTEPSEEVALR